MAFCRWSTNNCNCDLYVYEDIAGGYTMHVARKRWRNGCPPSDLSWEELDAYVEANLVTIGLPHDGEHYNFEDPADCAAKMRELVALGYICPQSAIEAVAQETEK